MSKTEIRWGLLAASDIASSFATAVQRSDSGSIAAVASRDGDRAAAFAADHGIAVAHGSYEALLSDPSVDVVYISTPHPLHAEWSIKAAEAGKHVLCEKPLALNQAEAMAVVDAAQRLDVFLMEGFMYRLHPQTATLLDLLREGAIGRVTMIDVAFSFGPELGTAVRLLDNDLGGGAILDIGCYCTSLARLVAAVATGHRTTEPIKVTGTGRVDPEDRVDHFALAALEFDGGILAQLSCSIMQTQEQRIKIYGNEGMISVSSPSWCSWMPEHVEGGRSEVILARDGQAAEVIPATADKTLWQYEAEHVAEYLDQRQSPVLPWEESLENMRTLDRWREAIGLRYDRELEPALTLTTAKRHLRDKVQGDEIPRARLRALDRDVSRLIMGVTSASTAARTAVMLDTFFERGGNCFDTAWEYEDGLAEERLGWWIASRRVRDEVVIVDKGGHTPDCYPEAVSRQHQESLDRLQTDYVDLYMLHRDNLDIPVGEFVDVLNEHWSAGTMRAFGASNWSLERIEEARRYAADRGLESFSTISNQFSLARMEVPLWEGCETSFDPEWRHWFEREDVPLLPWSAQARGFFVDPDEVFIKADWGDRDPEEIDRAWTSAANLERLARAREMAARLGVKPITIALAWVLQQRFPTFPIIGPRSVDQLNDSITAFGIDLTPDEASWLVDGGRSVATLEPQDT